MRILQLLFLEITSGEYKMFKTRSNIITVAYVKTSVEVGCNPMKIHN